MQIVRTIVWVLVLFTLLAFSFFNWKPVEVQIWPTMILETKLPALVIIAFLLGFVPMWLVHRAHRWRTHRRVTALEQATARMAGPAPVVTTTVAPEPVAADEPVAEGDPAADSAHWTRTDKPE